MIRVTSDRRCFVGGRRVHHGSAGLAAGLILAASGRVRLGAAVALTAAASDWDDRLAWLPDLLYRT